MPAGVHFFIDTPPPFLANPFYEGNQQWLDIHSGDSAGAVLFAHRGGFETGKQKAQRKQINL